MYVIRVNNSRTKLHFDINKYTYRSFNLLIRYTYTTIWYRCVCTSISFYTALYVRVYKTQKDIENMFF